MSGPFYFITHPNVVIDPSVPVPRWPLSAVGRARMRAALELPWVRDLGAVYCSTEQKALDAAAVLAGALDLDVTPLAALGENDRTSTGYLPPAEFEAVANAFFRAPHRSVRGWERAVDAQARIVRAITAVAHAETVGAIAVVSHGAVGALLHAHLSGNQISRRWDQPATEGGNYFRFTLTPGDAPSPWHSIDSSTT